MSNSFRLETLSKAVEKILCSPFEWRFVEGGNVVLENASLTGGTKGGTSQVDNFGIAKYPITNAQYEKFLKDPNGFSNIQWWEFSSEAQQWRKNHKNPKPTAFTGSDLPRTRISWFDSMAFCSWLSTEINHYTQHDPSLNTYGVFIRIPTEEEWQRAALGDNNWRYPWGDTLDETRGNYGSHVGQPSSVDKYPEGKSIYDVFDMTGNVWEWCLTGWNQEGIDVRGYTHRAIKGGAWNVSNPDHLRAGDRGCHPPRGRLNDCGFRVLLHLGVQ